MSKTPPINMKRMDAKPIYFNISCSTAALERETLSKMQKSKKQMWISTHETLLTNFMTFSSRLQTRKFLIKLIYFHKSKRVTKIKKLRTLLMTTKTGTKMLSNSWTTFSNRFFSLYFFFVFSFALADFRLMKAIQGSMITTKIIRI